MERDLYGRLQADAVEVLLLIAEHPDVPACEIFLERRAERGIESVNIRRTEALAIGGIGHHDAFGRRLCPLIERLALELDHILDTCRLDILAGDSHSVCVDVATVDLVGEFLLLAIVVIELLEEVCVEVGPLLESEALAEDTGVDIAGYEGRLNQECARAAHRIREIAVSAPSGLHDDARSQDLVDRCLGVVDLISAVTERLAARIERDRHSVFRNMDIEEQIGTRETDRRTLSDGVVEMVHDSVLHAIGHEARVGEIVAGDGRVYSERRFGRHIFAPVDVAHRVIQFVGCVGCELDDRLQDSERRTAAEIGLVHHSEISLKADHTLSELNVLGAEFDQFVTKDIFKTLKGLGYHRVDVFHFGFIS